MLALQWWSIVASAGYLEELAQSGPDAAVVSGAVGECDFVAGGDTIPLTRCDFTVGAVFVAGETEPSGVIDVWRPGGSTTSGGFVAPLGAPLVQPEHDHVLVLKNASDDGRWWVRRSVWRADVAGVGPMAVEREKRVTFDAERGWVPTRESVKIIPDATWTEVVDVQMNSVDFDAGVSTPNACDWACEVARIYEAVGMRAPSARGGRDGVLLTPGRRAEESPNR